MRFDRVLRWTGRTLLAMVVGIVLVVACGPETTDPPSDGTVEVAIATVGPGTVRQPSSGFLCRGDCTWTGEAAEATGFVAAADGANAFVAWTGACNTLDATCGHLLKDGDAITAAFAPHALRLHLTGDGEGEFRIQGPAVDFGCTEDCAVGLPQPLSLAITYFANGSKETVLDDWGGACAGAARSDYCLVPVEGATDVSKTWRRPPLAIDETYTTPRNTRRSVSAAMGVLRNVIDTPGDTHTARLVNDVTHGTLALAEDGGFSYMPDPGFAGSDTFTYRVRDAFGNLSNTATVTITVTATVPPVIESFTADPASIDIGDSTTLQWNVTGANTITINDGTNNLTIPSNDATIIVTPTTTTTYTLTATNPDGNTTATTTVTVEAPDLPTITTFTATPSTITTGESSNLAWTVTNATSIDIADETNAIIYNGTNLDATIIVTPTTTTTYTLTATNPDGNTTATTTVTVEAPDLPIAVDDSYSTVQDSTLTRNAGEGVLANDIGDNLTALLVDDAEEGGLTLNADGSFTYEADDVFIGTDTFTYYAHDGIANSNTATVSITVLSR